MENPAQTMKRPNEENACASFITILKSLTGIGYEVFSRPDDVNRRTKDIDFILSPRGGKNGTIAVEHTRVESFEGQIGYVTTWCDIVCLVNAECRERIPCDRYYFLAGPLKLVDPLVWKSKDKQGDAVVQSKLVSYLSAWVAKTAPALLLEDSDMQTEYEGHKITLTCRGTAAQLNGNVWGMPEEPQNQKALQSERLGRAVGDKVPKLARYKPGFKTALLLEDVAGTLRGTTLCGYGGLEEVDYVVVFVSNKDRMITGNVWKEGPVWHSFVPGDRRFPRGPRHMSGGRGAV